MRLSIPLVQLALYRTTLLGMLKAAQWAEDQSLIDSILSSIQEVDDRLVG